MDELGDKIEDILREGSGFHDDEFFDQWVAEVREKLVVLFAREMKHMKREMHNNQE
jgi:hypothetical protein